jgi:2-C-methyl-D-erythritol 4-phosphate cytidylyltransferase/2-C-methyl-D-erythritol 2,4-cyclodiphosphate synthase
MKRMNFCAIIVAAGSGSRAGEGGPKQWRNLGGKPVVRWSVEAMIAAGATNVIVAAPPGEEDTAKSKLEGLNDWRVVSGGATRWRSTLEGLLALEPLHPEAVLIHDAARPFVAGRHVTALLTALLTDDGAIPALPAVDTLKRRDTVDGRLVTVDRSGLMQAQTPQAFRFAALLSAYRDWPDGETPTDDAQVLERAGGSIGLIPGDPVLLKLTFPEDFVMAEILASGLHATHVGQGFDAHRFGPGDGVWLCGVRIDHDRALVGHSDADAGLHALTDAILGAIGQGDIGDHFPPSDPRWKGVASSVFLQHAATLVTDRGGRILNVDVTLICEKPKISNYRLAMRECIATLLDISIGQVSVKATTTERMGFTGREEGLAAQAVAAVEMPA